MNQLPKTVVGFSLKIFSYIIELSEGQKFEETMESLSTIFGCKDREIKK